MATAKSRTTNFKFVLPRFNQQTWQDDYYNNMRAIDGVLSRFFNIANYVGIWQNATQYNVGDRVLDAEQALILEVLVQHVTDPEPKTFLEFRRENPSFYEAFTSEVQFRGEWEPDTDYAAGDFVTYTTGLRSEQEFAVAATSHQSGSSYQDDRDEGLWTTLLDFGDFSKDWAVQVGSKVDGVDWSAKSYAIGTANDQGSAKRWAVEAEDTEVISGEYSAFHWAQKAQSAGSGTLLVSTNDSTKDTLSQKLVAGSGVTLTEQNDGGNETLEVSSSGASKGFAIAMALIF